MPGRNGKPADLASLSVDDEVASIVADVDAAGMAPPVTIVAHSSGGLTVPGVLAELRARGVDVDRIILNAASVPPEGGCGLDCMQTRHKEGVLVAVDMAKRDGIVLTTSGPPDEAEAFRTSYGGDPLDDETLAYVVDPARCVKDTLNHYFQPVHWSAVAGTPVIYILNERDRPVPAALQDEMIARLPEPPRVIRLDTGHIPPVTDPRGFAALLTVPGRART